MNLTHRNNRVKRRMRVFKGWAVVNENGTLLPETVRLSRIRAEIMVQPGERVARVHIKECNL